MNDRLHRADSMIVVLDKNNVPSRLRFAAYSLTRQDTATALRLYKEVAILTPNDPKPFKNLFVLSKARGSSDDATLYLKNYLLLDKRCRPAPAAWRPAVCENDQNGALDSYRRGFRRNPSAKGHFRQYAGIVLQKKFDNEAVTVDGRHRRGRADASSMGVSDIYRKRTSAECVKCTRIIPPTQKLSVLTALADRCTRSRHESAIVSYEQPVLLNPKPSLNTILGNLQMKLDKR
jgi:hypothetical protein